MSHLWFCLLAAGSPDSDPAPSAPLESSTDIRCSTRVRAPPSHLSDYHCYFALATLHEPHTYREASTNPLWQQAMADELDALHKTHTWDMTTLPPGKSAVGWDSLRNMALIMRRLLLHVARLTSVRSLLAVAAVRHWPLFQMDVKNAFLNGDLLEEVYMQPPPGYPDSQNQVCHLRRALYGLKHAGRDLQKFLSQQFEMKDLGTLSYFLGLEVTSSSDGYYLSQAKYASDLFSKASLTDSKIVSTPLELNVKLNTTDGTSRGHSFMVFTSRHSLPLSCAPMLMQTGLEIPLIVALPQVIASYWVPLLSLSVARNSLLLLVPVLKLSTVLLPMPPRNSFWLRWLLADMGAPQTTSTPIHSDNHSAIHIAHNDIFHERTKHIEIDCHFIRHHLQQNALHLLSVSSKDQLADVFTKSHPPGRLCDLVSKLKMASSSPPCV
uniref:Reverse transcriptase Ty1/copia-type domain-containing protein n=1 Tax=Fagus sylvatica TaxID=28930 RepID=A0A2N9GUB1_FAGSY